MTFIHFQGLSHLFEVVVAVVYGGHRNLVSNGVRPGNTAQLYNSVAQKLQKPLEINADRRQTCKTRDDSERTGPSNAACAFSITNKFKLIAR